MTIAVGPREVACRRSGNHARSPVARAAGSATPFDRVLELQRSAGNRAVTSLVAQRQAGVAPGGPFDFGHMGKLVEGAVSSDPYDQQPALLRAVIEESAKSLPIPETAEKPSDARRHMGEVWWSRLEPRQRLTVVSVYNRMQTLGLWGPVERIILVTPPRSLHLAGPTPSVVFAGDRAAMRAALVHQRRMCYDPGLGKALHKGQESNREISTSDSLHLSTGRSEELGGNGDFDAHLDAIASPKSSRNGACEYDVVRTGAHITREAAVKAGFSLFPENPAQPGRPDMFEDLDREQEAPPLGVGWTVRFGR